MSTTSQRFFLTLVGLLLVSQVQAAPHFDSPQPEVTEEDSTVPTPKAEAIENMSVTPAPANRQTVESFVTQFNRQNYYYPYRQEMAAYIGAVFGFKDSTDDENDDGDADNNNDELMNALVGFSYLLPSRTSPKWEIGAALSTVGNGHINFARRTIYNEKGAFRPYYEYGFMHKLVPEEKFASFSNWENYLVRAGVGLSDIRTPPKSVQLELEVALGVEDVLVMFTYGYAWGF